MNNRLVLILFLLISTVSYSQVSLQWQFYGDTPEESRFIVADSHENVYTLGAYGGLRKYNHTGDTVFYNTDTTQYEAKAIDIDGNDNIVTVGTYFGTAQDYRILVQNLIRVEIKFGLPLSTHQMETENLHQRSHSISLTIFISQVGMAISFLENFLRQKFHRPGLLFGQTVFPKMVSIHTTD
ncbi:MAG: hypothetical protein IPP29_11315 [Bacteroidetes bacterium]|nr:hypothetical protein [Bacteroidota bacterium]